jgi:hypothetical protein
MYAMGAFQYNRRAKRAVPPAGMLLANGYLPPGA